METGISPTPTPPQKMRAYRTRMRAQGMRCVQIWLPDTRASSFCEEARRQSLIVAQSPGEAEIMGWLEEAGDTQGWME